MTRLGTSLSYVVSRRTTGKCHPITVYEDPEVEGRYNSTLSLTSALDGVGGKLNTPTTVTPERDPEPIV